MPKPPPASVSPGSGCTRSSPATTPKASTVSRPGPAPREHAREQHPPSSEIGSSRCGWSRPPADPREDRAIPPNVETLPDRPPTSRNDHRAADPARSVPKLAQHRPPAPLHRPPHTRTGLHRTPQSDPDRTRSIRMALPHRHRRQTPSATPGNFATSASAPPTPAPPCSYSSTTATSPPATRTPARSSPNTPSTPTATTSRETHDQPRQR